MLSQQIRRFETWEAAGPPAVHTRGESALGPLAGVDVRQVAIRGMLHGFLNLPAEVEPVRRCLDLIAGTVARGGL